MRPFWANLVCVTVDLPSGFMQTNWPKPLILKVKRPLSPVLWLAKFWKIYSSEVYDTEYSDMLNWPFLSSIVPNMNPIVR